MQKVKNLKSVEINLQRNVLHLYDFMLLSGSIECDNHNGTIGKCEKRSNKWLQRNFFALVWLHAVRW